MPSEIGFLIFPRGIMGRDGELAATARCSTQLLRIGIAHTSLEKIHVHFPLGFRRFVILRVLNFQLDVQVCGGLSEIPVSLS